MSGTNRYHRQTLFEPIGETGQDRLMESHVLIVGAGALGSGSAEALVRAGIGKLTLIDRDYVEESNLQRQQLFSEQDAYEKLPKAIGAKNRLNDINSMVEVEAIIADAGGDLLSELAPAIDLIIDATDNFDIRMLVNDISQKFDVPWIYGACVASYGMTFTIIPGQTPCLQCLQGYLPASGATCDSVGVIQPVVQHVVSYQVTEAMKLLTGNRAQISGKLIAFDLWKNEHMEMEIEKLKKPDCSSCSENRSYAHLSYGNQMKTTVMCGRDTVQIRPQHGIANLSEVAENLRSNKNLQLSWNPYLLSIQDENFRIVLFKDGRALIHGTMDEMEAKNVYYRYMG